MSTFGPPRRLKVAFLTTDNRWFLNDYGNPTPHFGPAMQAVLDGFLAFPELEVHIVSSSRKPVNAPEKLADNLWFHSQYVPKIGWLRTGYQGCIRATRKRLREIRPDIVHGQGTESDCSISAVLSGFINVVTLHGNMVEMARVMKARFGSFHWFAARLENFVLRRTAGVFCNSKFTEQLVRPRTRRTWLVPNALRPDFFRAPPSAGRPGRCVLVHAGVVCENKQQMKMLQLARSLHRKKLDFELHFVGHALPTSPYARAFLEQIREAETEGYARYLGMKPAAELIGCFDRSSALVHTPIAESFGLVVAEALSRNLRFFGFRVGGVPDIVEGADGAVLVPPEDWAGLEQAIEAWLKSGHPASRPTADLIKQRYHPEAIARHHIAIYREVLGGQV